MELDQSEKDAFVSEITDRLEEYNDILLDFEKAASNKDLLHKLFRVAHTIKGNAGFVGLNNMVRIAHVAENLLTLVRDGQIKLNQELANLLFSSGDLVTKILDSFSSGETDPLDVDVEGVAKKIENSIENHLNPAKNQSKSDAPENQTENNKQDILSSQEIKKEDNAKTKTIETNYKINIQIKKKAPLPGMRAYLIRSKLEKIAKIEKEKPPMSEYDNRDFDGKIMFELTTLKSESQIRETIKNHEIESISFDSNLEMSETDKNSLIEQASVLFETDDSEISESQNTPVITKKTPGLDALRVPILKIDDILNLVGELLSANSAYMALAADYRSNYGNRGLYVHLRDNSEEMARISGELQEKVMRVRMIPVGTVFSRFRRLMRDYNASHPDKEAILKLTGEETEIDKKQIDSIYDPLMHLLRNALDHGIENRGERKKQGKDPIGTILLNSYQDGNSIFIEVSDDGKGLDLERIKNKALGSGLVSEEELSTYGHEEITNLILLPGFSTATKVTDVSGRGVGMDVVKRNIEIISGSLNIESKEGEGSTFRIKIPLSMAIITALKIYVQDKLMAIPISAILETTKVFEKDITIIDKFENIKVRNEHISLIRLDSEMGLSSGANYNKNTKIKKPVVIVQYENTKIALMVDELIGYEDMVIKSLSKNYEEIEGVAGAALLGRGEICLILDVYKLIAGIINKGNKEFETRTKKLLQNNITTQNKAIPEPIPTSASANKTTIKKSGLNTDQLATIKKIVSTGRKKAHEALCKLTDNNDLRMKISTTRIQTIKKYKKNLELVCQSEQCHTFYVGMNGDIKGNQIVIINSDNIIKLARMLYKDESLDSLSMEVISSIKEVTNVLAVSYTNAITNLTGLEVLPSAPRHIPDYTRIFTENMLFEQDEDASILLIETEFWLDSNKSLLFFYVLPDQASFQKMITGSL